MSDSQVTDGSRRRVLLGVACAGLVAMTERVGAQSVCGDPDDLSDGERSMRSSLDYVDESADRSQTCRVCNYFNATQGSACGQCLILHGEVSGGGHCVSWTAKSQQPAQR